MQTLAKGYELAGLYEAATACHKLVLRDAQKSLKTISLLNLAKLYLQVNDLKTASDIVQQLNESDADQDLSRIFQCIMQIRNKNSNKAQKILDSIASPTYDKWKEILSDMIKSFNT